MHQLSNPRLINEGNKIESALDQTNAVALHFYLLTLNVYTTRNAIVVQLKNARIPPLARLPSQSSMMPMTYTSSSMSTQIPLPHNLPITTRSTRRSRLKHHTSKIANTKLIRAITDQRTIRTAAGQGSAVVIGSNDLVVLTCGAWGCGLPDYLAEVAEAVFGGSVADEGTVLVAGCAVAVGWGDGAGHAWGRRC